jgi:hypothetical protein
VTTLAEARTELGAALVTAGLAIAPRIAAPVSGQCVVLGAGFDGLDHIGRGQLLARFRVVLFAGRWDQEATIAILDAMKLDALDAVRTAPAWRLDDVQDDRRTNVAGNDYLTAAVIAARIIDI